MAITGKVQMAKTNGAMQIAFSKKSAFPAKGRANIQYVATDENKIYRYDKSSRKYICIGTNPDGMQSQIDNIVISASSSGNVSAEVAQSRTSEDGTTFDTLKDRLDSGDAQVSDLKDMISSFDSLCNLKLTLNDGYITSAGGVVSLSGKWKYASFPVKKGETYYIWSSTSASAYPAAIKSKSGSVTAVLNQGDNFGTEYVVPYDGTLYVCGWNGVGVKTKTIVMEINDNINHLYSILGLNKFEWTSGGYYDSNCKLQSAAQCSYMTVDVMAGEKYAISVAATMLVYPLFFRDSTGSTTTVIPQGVYDNYIYTVPSNGRLYISTFTGVSRYVKKYEESNFNADLDYLENRVTGEKTIVCYGDSLTQGNQDGTGGTYPKYLAAKLNDYAVVNAGSGGDSSKEVASRQGGIGLYAKPFTIPAAATAVEITLMCMPETDKFYPGRQNIAQLNQVEIAGVKGKITYSGSASSQTGEHHYYFTRSAAGEAVEVTRPTLIKTSGYDRRHNTQIIWAGTNDKPTLETLKSKTIPTIDSMIRFLHTDNYLIVGLTSKSYMSEIAEVNDYMQQYYGNKYVNVRDYILNYGLGDAGITPTTQDTADIAAGEIPTSLRNDAVHFNAKGYEIVANLVYEHGKVLGYWS